MLNGERRLVSARRGGGMTVLGRVAVPKPVFLPSQRGTLGGGSHSSSSAPNAWGSPVLSPPNTDGVPGSPIRLNGRPSSGGSGTRPSTAGSDKSHEPVPNPWGPSSRPTSSSGVLASNQTSMASTRPRSAETRPASSQLSRFAESISENSVAWSASETTEKLGASSSKINGFSFSSGDFPTLGSEKNSESHVRQGHSSQGRPISASGGVTALKERLETSPTEDESIDASTDRGTVNTWKRESSPYVGSGATPSTEKWLSETQPCPNPNMPPQHFDHWHGSPVCNSPDGVWYRGGPSVGPPYGIPGPPGSYPLEPFAYYRPQLPARPLPNSQLVPRPGSAPSGYHPKNGDSYRPHLPDSYIQPIMPVRPGVYPGQVPYDGYYAPPPVSFCNSGERDAPVMRMATGPRVYSRNPNQNVHPDSTNFHARPGGYGPTSTAMVKEQVESGYPHDTHRGPYKVLLKQQDGLEVNDIEKREHTVTTNMPHHERGNQKGTPVKENDGGADRRKDEPVDYSKTAFSGKPSSLPAGIHGGNSSVPVGMNLPEIMSKAKAVDGSLVTKPETAAISGEGLQQVFSTKKNPTLMDKIEGLNNKARISDSRYDVGHVPTREEKMKRFMVVNAKADHSTNEAGTGAVSTEKATSGMLIPTHEASESTGDKRLEPTAFNGIVVSSPVCKLQASAVSESLSSEGGEMTHSHIYKRTHGVQGRADYRGKGRFNTQESEEWRKKSLVADSPIAVPVTNVETSPDVCMLDNQSAQEVSEKSDSNLQSTAGGELCATSASDPSDYEAQRAKMKERATQRVKQRQKEEEERTREQKAKALAKLEELNRRTLTETQKLDQALPPSGDIQHKQEETQSNAGLVTDASSSGELPNSALGWNSGAVTQMSDNNTNRFQEPTNMPKKVPSEAPLCAPQDPVVTHNSPLPLPLPREVNTVDVADRKIAPQVHDSCAPKQKQVGHKRKQNISLDKISSDKSIPFGTIGSPKSHVNIVSIVNASSGEFNFPSNIDTSHDPSVQHKKKNNRSGKNKHKLDEVSSGAPLSLLMPMEGHPGKAPAGSSKPRASDSMLEVSSIQAPISRESAGGQDPQEIVPSADPGWSLSTEEAHRRVNNQLKPQPPRRMPRNTQATRSTEKMHSGEAVVWAPVRSLNKNEASEEASHNTTIEAHTPSTKNGHGTQNNQKSRRAEMERYVPKPVAKELSQQGNSQQPSSPSVNQAVPDEATGRAGSGSLNSESSGPDDLAIGKGGFAVESKNGESKHNKHGKTHGSWRQRASVESPLVQRPEEGSSFSSDPSKTAQKPIEQHQPSKPETHSPKGQAKYSDNWNAPNNPVSTEPVTGRPVVVKDHGVVGRGKRQPFRTHKGIGHNHKTSEHKDLHSGDTDEADAQSSSLELSQSDGRIALRENHGVNEHASSQWQPKSQAYVAPNRQGRRANGGQRVTTQAGSVSEKEFPPQGGGYLASRNDKDNSTAVVRHHPHQFDTQKISVAEVSNVGHHEAKRERKGVDSSKEGARSPKQSLVNSGELAQHENVDIKHEHSFSSVLHRHGHHNGRFGRGHEVLHGGRSPARQDNRKQQHQPANSDRRRHSSHYEYQPVGSSNNKPNESFEEGSGVKGSKYHDRGQTHSRRGGANFYGRDNGTIRMSSAYDRE